MQWLKDFVNGFAKLLYDGFQWLLEGLAELIKYLAFTIYDGLLTVIYGFFEAIDFSASAFNIAAQYAGLPTQLIWLINAVNIPQSMSYIVTGTLIRMAMNLLPAAVTRI